MIDNKEENNSDGSAPKEIKGKLNMMFKDLQGVREQEKLKRQNFNAIQQEQKEKSDKLNEEFYSYLTARKTELIKQIEEAKENMKAAACDGDKEKIKDILTNLKMKIL